MAATKEAGPSISPNHEAKKKPVVILCIGMAGSGKTTLMQRLNSYLHSKSTPPYILNLDPAVLHMPYQANIDIRDTVDYKQVMKQYNLGPNGGILTALNLFTTKFDQVLGYVEKRSEEVEYILVDTPGQIEIFTWSASGAIITDAIASSLPTVVAYIIDTPRTTSPITFMSNMLYACSILYKTRLPFMLVFNKTDVQPHDFAVEWMTDFEKYQEALNDKSKDEHGEGSYVNSLMGSMCLVLEEFYNKLRAVGVSAMTGEGMRAFFNAVEEARQEYETEYKPELDRVASERAAQSESDKKDQLERLMHDMKLSASTNPDSRSSKNPFGPFPRDEREDRYYDEEQALDLDDEEQEAIRRQMEAEEEDAEADELGKLDVHEPDIGQTAGGLGVIADRQEWPAPK
ncbi:uncharacterized protein L203_104098 [Cryptococcus depauperatus CBS 7841]|uniref:GPN-loop GTPase n=1 Tax=Cryptococcus depauperatus CBS 7841 TaxID=1295531 RepID=A0A1E3IBG9_9TREE|nr:XPA-binding protein 1 [Cryptococcus depauperatus CBS 7841]